MSKLTKQQNKRRRGRPITADNPLAEIMRDKQISRKMLSDKSGISASNITKLLQGQSPTYRTAVAIAAALKTTPDKLFTSKP